jgi:nicotianamine synthase
MGAMDVVRRIEHVHQRLAAAPDLRPGSVIDGLFAELVALVLDTPAAEADAALDDPVVQTLLPRLVQLSAQGEYELELAWAERIAASRRPHDELRRFPYLANYRELSRLEHAAVAGHRDHRVRRDHRGHRVRRVAFVGSGPLPLTALFLAEGFGVAVDNIDVDAAAITAARAVGVALGIDRWTFHQHDVRAHDLGGYDLVVLAALVGLTPDHKHRVLAHLAATMAPGALLLARSARGLRRLLYPEADPSRVDGFRLLGVIHPRGQVINSVAVACRR